MSDEHLKLIWAFVEQVTKAAGSPLTLPPLKSVQSRSNRLSLAPFASGARIICIPLVLQIDDTSANRSKQWNKMHTLLMSYAGLPFKLQQYEYYTHVLACSQHAHPLELLEPIIASIVEHLHEGIESYDPFNGTRIIITGSILCVLGDNPMHSMLCSHMGSNAKKFCRLCFAEYSKDKVTDAQQVDSYMNVPFILTIT
jgi:hypothetical protein